MLLQISLPPWADVVSTGVAVSAVLGYSSEAASARRVVAVVCAVSAQRWMTVVLWAGVLRCALTLDVLVNLSPSFVAMLTQAGLQRLACVATGVATVARGVATVARGVAILASGVVKGLETVARDEAKDEARGVMTVVETVATSVAPGVATLAAMATGVVTGTTVM